MPSNIPPGYNVEGEIDTNMSSIHEHMRTLKRLLESFDTERPICPNCERFYCICKEGK